MGGAKGAALALMVEILAGALTGSNFGYEASSFLDAQGPPPRVGQCFIIIDPRRGADPQFGERIEALFDAISAQPGTRLPGDRRLQARARAAAQGLAIPSSLYRELTERAAGSGAGAGVKEQPRA
jgi:(2R)-3-sulfolactate dehydrogenase (NADP+)